MIDAIDRLDDDPPPRGLMLMPTMDGVTEGMLTRHAIDGAERP